MPEETAIKFRKRQKKFRRELLGLATLSFLISAVVLFVPRANDLASGPQEPMRLYTETLARGLAKTLNGSPILIAKEDRPVCQAPEVAQKSKIDRLYVVLRYSEHPLLLCVTLYRNASPTLDSSGIVTLNEATGINLGSKISTPAQVVPVGYSNVRLPDDLSKALDWRLPEDPFYTLVGKLHVDESFPDGVALSLREIESQPVLGFRDLEAERHDLVNTILLWCLVLSALAALFAAASVLVASAGIRFERAHGHTTCSSSSGDVDPGDQSSSENVYRKQQSNAQSAAIEQTTSSGEPQIRSDRPGILMPYSHGSWQRKKRILACSIGTSFLLTVVSILVRFTHAPTEMMAGSPHYIRTLTERFAREAVRAEGPQAPVMLVNSEDDPCDPVPTANLPPQAVYYVLSYSEKLGLSCFTAYMVPAAAVPAGVSWFTLSPNQGQNYGRKFSTSVRVIPFDRSLKIYSPQYISLLHWRTQIPARLPEGFVAARNFPPRIRPVDVQEVDFFGVDISLKEIRGEVARNYNRLNWLLLAISSLGLIGLVFLGGKMIILYGEVSRKAKNFGYELNWPIFLAENPDLVVARVQQEYQGRQIESRRQARNEQLLRRMRLEMIQKLEFLQSAVVDESHRNRIRECLAREAPELESMQALWTELQPHVGQKTPESRLDQLLDSSRQYCDEEEFAQLRNDAFAILGKSGFREAREFVVDMHTKLRARVKALDEEVHERVNNDDVAP